MSSNFLVPQEINAKVIQAGTMPSRVPFHNFVKALIATGRDLGEVNIFLKKNHSGQ